MLNLSLKEFLTLIEQDLSGEVAKLQADISTIDTQIAQRTNPLMAQKARLQKLLMVKQQQMQRDMKSAAKPGQQGQTPTPQGPMQPGTQGSQPSM